MNNLLTSFTMPLLAWFDQHGRKNFPWQNPRSAYNVWISEIMLQQTQVQTVIPYFERFMRSFPTIERLGAATEDEILAHWSGLGYYSRGRNLHKTAQLICKQYAGKFPQDMDELLSLPGIGPSTAAAIASQAFNQPTAILDGNVKRVLSRYFTVEGLPQSSAVNKQLWQLADKCMSQTRCADYTQAIMDLGALCCTRHKPQCRQCPLQQTCKAYLTDTVNNYPFRKPKKTLPTKQQVFLVLHNDEQAIYLEKRPPTGIWGGLWCLPSIDNEESLLSFLQEKYQVNTATIHKLMDIRHSFSHFHLEIKAIAINVQPKNTHCVESIGWFHAGAFDQLGLAKPIQEIIQHFLRTTDRV